jgi:hypothetical protein
MEHRKLEVNISNVNLEAYWNFDVDDQQCGLCHKDLSNTTLDELTSGNIDNKIVICKCNHGFHSSCLNLWKKTGNTFCPKDKSNLTVVGFCDNTMVTK